MDPLAKAPPRADGYCVCAGAFLFGNAVIIGGGRFVGPTAALLAARVKHLAVLEADPVMVALWGKAVESHWSQEKLSVYEIDFRDWTPTRPVHSLFYDPFPESPEVRDAALFVGDWIAPNGRIIFLQSLHPEIRFNGEWRVEYEIEPYGPGERIITLRKG